MAQGESENIPLPESRPVRTVPVPPPTDVQLGPLDPLTYSVAGGDQFTGGNPPSQLQTVSPAAQQSWQQGSAFPPGVDPYTVYQEQQARTEKLRGELDTNIARRQQLAGEAANLPHPALPRLQNAPQAPQQHPRSIFGEVAPALMLFATLGSGFVKGHAVQALSAATGLINGWDKGDAEMRQAALDNWQNKAKQLADQNKVELDRYGAVLDDRKLSSADKMAQINALAAEFNDKIRLHAIESGDMRSLFTLQNAQTKANTQLQAAAIRTGAVTPLTDDALRNMAQRAMTGEPISNIGLGRRPENLNRFNNILTEEMNKAGMSPQQMASKRAEYQAYQTGLRITAARGGQLATTVQEMLSFSGSAIEASNAVQRGKWVPINSLMQDAKRMASDIPLQQFTDWNEAIITLYTQIMQRGNVPSVHARQRAERLLNTATSREAYEAGIKVLAQEAELAEAAPGMAMEVLKDRFLGRSPAPAAHPAPSAPSGATQGWH